MPAVDPEGPTGSVQGRKTRSRPGCQHRRAGHRLFGLINDHKGVEFAGLVQAGWPAWTGFVLVSVMPAIFEELAFRGVIQSSLERVFNARDAWLIQAALFSLLHLSPLVFPSHFAMGLAFGWIRMRSRSLYPAMLLHGAWNALVVFQELAQ